MSVALSPHKIDEPRSKKGLSFKCRSKREVLSKMRVTLEADAKSK